ncbi:MAG: hypothetical protein JW798_16385 [Prolixibacteraceae bacterium]|nr:hypothetical protein [Prolixibacteraceae bacterium]
MKISLLIILFAGSLFFVGCEKDEYNDPNYPTIIEEADSLTIYGIIDKLAASPLSYCTSVDTFGFCFITDELEGCIENYDTLEANLTMDEIRDLFTQALSDYRDLLHITDPSEITIKSVSAPDGKMYHSFIEEYTDSLQQIDTIQPYWVVRSGLQEYNGIPVRGTMIQMMVSGNEITAIGGRRFQNIYVPTPEVYSAEMAEEMLTGKELTYKRSTLTPSTGTYWYDPVKVIVPISRSGSIELHVCWALYPESWEVIVDCYTGKILSSIDVSIL